MTPSRLPLHFFGKNIYHIFGLFTIAVIITGTPESFSINQITLDISKNSYTSGELITIKGQVANSPNQFVAIEVKDPSGITILIRTVKTGNDGNFMFQFKLSPTAQSGSYDIIANSKVDGNIIKTTKSITLASTDQQSKDNQLTDEQSRQNANQLQDQNKTEGENQPQSNQKGIDKINNENNNEKATHQGNQEDANNIENARQDKTVAAEVNIGSGNTETKSIDNNIEMRTNNSTSDNVSITVGSKTESGPKVIIFNLNSTTIDVANVKYLQIIYDGQSIQPATDVNAVLHPKSTDNPVYAIIVTQNSAQVLVSIPRFSTHTITIDKISKVIPAVPEFPFAILALIIATFSIILIPKIRL